MILVIAKTVQDSHLETKTSENTFIIELLGIGLSLQVRGDFYKCVLGDEV